MSYAISWYDPEKIMFMKSPESPSESEVFDADKRLHELLTVSKNNRVHLIIDDSQIRSMPGVSVTMKLETLSHPKMGWTVVIGQSDKVYRMLYTITCHLRRLPLYFADSMEEAKSFLIKTAEMEPTE